ncbi:nucleotide-binding protein [Rhodoferax sp.]|uniref:nucleotide-binding protein n=1 Tax=Rhodoferax sp. TaxID=50421 RepID=UPI002841ABD5|nr:nucleotide-binding protein [Rhodoferax sp.]MDR3368128.1 nucleotide-binding protein [Rhodoferax sp.]
MKSIVLAALLVSTPLSMVWAATPAAPATQASATVTGEVLETKDVPPYTYLLLKTKDGETWAAVNKADFKKGASVTIDNVVVMENFESHTLKRTFPVILFGTVGGAGQAITSPHGGAPAPVITGPIKVAKASGANAYTVAEIVAKAKQLKTKTVVLSGKVVKYNPGIMGKNWIHLQDGSGSAASNSNDILVTSAAPTQIGSVITVTGVVNTDKDFGAGYVYKVLIEDASIKP